MDREFHVFLADVSAGFEDPSALVRNTADIQEVYGQENDLMPHRKQNLELSGLASNTYVYITYQIGLALEFC